MGPDGRYAFLDVVNSDMAKVVLELSGQVQLMGQSITVSRPAGFVERERLAVNAEHTSVALMQFQVCRRCLCRCTPVPCTPVSCTPVSCTLVPCGVS